LERLRHCRFKLQLILHDVQAALSQELSSFGLFGRLHAADAGSSRELHVATDFECVAADSTPGLLAPLGTQDGNHKTASIVVKLYFSSTPTANPFLKKEKTHFERF
jgi:hypothetical protein